MRPRIRGPAIAVALALFLLLSLHRASTPPLEPAPSEREPSATIATDLRSSESETTDPDEPLPQPDTVEPETARGQVPPFPPALHRGRVRDAHGEPIKGAQLLVHILGGPRTFATARTGPEGRFSFAVPSLAREADLVVLARGYCPAIHDIRGIGGGELEVVMTRGLSISGIIRDDLGGPVRASISAIRLSPGGGGPRSISRDRPHANSVAAMSSEHGLFRITGLAEGRYRLRVSSLNLHDDGGPGPVCAAGSAGHEVVVTWAACLSLSLRDSATNAPIVERVEFVLRPSEVRNTVRGSATGGVALIRGLTPGRWWITVRAKGHAPWQAQVDLPGQREPFEAVARLARTGPVRPEASPRREPELVREPGSEENSTVAELVGVLQGGGSQERMKAAIALGESGDRKAVSLLAKTLSDDPDAFVRRAAATALGKLSVDAHAALVVLIRALADRSPFVATEAHQAFAKITGRSLDWRARMPKQALEILIAAELKRIGE